MKTVSLAHSHASLAKDPCYKVHQFLPMIKEFFQQYPIIAHEYTYTGDGYKMNERKRTSTRNYDEQLYDKYEHQEGILNIVLDSAYEGIVVVDHEGKITRMNDAYCRVIGMKREEIIGKHVQHVIDNTNLHNTIKTGKQERGKLQNIRGQDMIVHRIPIRKNNQITGAIGMLVFEGIKELNKIYASLQDKYEEQGTTIQPPHKKPHIEEMNTLERIVGKSEAIGKAKKVAYKVAKTNATVLITGESGTGKELYARGIHEASPFASGTFISVNCGAIPESLFESELFGYEEGAFSGAKRGGKKGKLELAQNGSLFLDEIGEMPLQMQTKLLRVLQEKEYERVGGIKKEKLNVRIIAATNRDLRKMIQSGLFREDLFYRINVIELHIPPLRKRKEDIPQLVQYYLNYFSGKYGEAEKNMDKTTMAYFSQYDWFGNVRELMNTIERLVVLTEGDQIEPHHLPAHIWHKEEIATEHPIQTAASLHDKVDSLKESEERTLIIQALTEAGGNKTKAAKNLGIHRTTLYQKMKKYNVV